MIPDGNGRLRALLTRSNIEFLGHLAGSVERILPHVEVTRWSESGWQKRHSVSANNNRTEIHLSIPIGRDASNGACLQAIVRRRGVPGIGTGAKPMLDTREHDICKHIAWRISEIFQDPTTLQSEASTRAIGDAFDEQVVSQHLREHHSLKLPVATVFEELHKLSEQTYENRSLMFGCLLDPNRSRSSVEATFPIELLRSKKYRALSDGVRTAYYVSTEGGVLEFIDLTRFEKKPLSERHFFPQGSEWMARTSRQGRCGIALSRQGDLLVFDEGSLRFTYRYGRWQYWNHANLISLLRDRARRQRVPKKILGRVVGAIYRASLDVSFRGSGGLFLILHNRRDLREVVRVGDAIADSTRDTADRQFDSVVQENTIQALPRAVAVELSSLDGAIVLENSGRILAYAAVLQPKKKGRQSGTEGSRTKAAVGASNYGLAIKISADGEITVYHQGREFISV